MLGSRVLMSWSTTSEGLRDRFTGTLLIAVGATVVFLGSALGAGFGNLALFSAGHAIGITLMYVGFLRATHRSLHVATAA
jgi:hypothetical protein